jgi:hypothetical protein
MALPKTRRVYRGWPALLALGAACAARPPTVRNFPTYSEHQSEWIQSHCRVAFVEVVDADRSLDDFRRQAGMDLIERLSASAAAVELVGYKCPVAVPEEIARGEAQ